MGFFSNLRDSFKKATSSNVAASDRNKSSGKSNPSTAAGRVAQNLMSDLAISFGNTTGVSAAGIKDYEERTAASKAAMEKFQADTANNDSGSSSSPPPVTTTKPEPEPEPEPDPVIEEITPDTTIITDPPAKLTPDTPADEDAVEDPDNTGATEGSGAPDEPDTGAGTTTALGAEEEADKLEEVAKGETEKKVADTIRSTGRRSTIRTTPRGLLNTDDPSSLRPRRSLMGGGLLV